MDFTLRNHFMKSKLKMAAILWGQIHKIAAIIEFGTINFTSSQVNTSWAFVR